MSKIIVVYANKKNGKFEFTKEELEALLDDAYNKGYAQGKSDTFIWQSPTAVPSWIGSPSITAVPCVEKTITTCDGSCTGTATFDLKSNKDWFII